MIKQIRLLDNTYKIKPVKTGEFKGSLTPEKKLIEISQFSLNKNKTLLHELSHLFLRTYLPKNQFDESLVNSMADFYYEVFCQMRSFK